MNKPFNIVFPPPWGVGLPEISDHYFVGIILEPDRAELEGAFRLRLPSINYQVNG